MESYRLVCEQEKEERKELAKTRELVTHTQTAQGILQTIAKQIQDQAHQQIAQVVGRCLETVFEDPYEFKIVFEQKRGKTEARLVFIRNGEEIDPMFACGGGVLDVAAFALRLACLILRRPKVRRLLVLDEPWKHLSAEYRPALRQLILALAKELDIQFVIITHSTEFEIGKIVRLGERE